MSDLISRREMMKRGGVIAIGLMAPLAVAGRFFWRRAVQLDVAVTGPALGVVLAALAFGLLGLLDDLVEETGVRGFRGHLGALRGGRLSGGGAKLLGGLLAALLVATLAVGGDWWQVLLGAVVVASAANVANLFDLRPGRAAKVFLPLWLLGCLLDPTAGAWSAGMAGAALACLPLDLREEGMLGDSGANALGAVVGTLLATGPAWLD